MARIYPEKDQYRGPLDTPFYPTEVERWLRLDRAS